MSITSPLARAVALVGMLLLTTAVAVAQDERAAAALRMSEARIVPGDDVIVVVSREPDLSASVIVDERNEIALPRLGIINLRDYSPTSLRDTIRARYGKFLRDPVINVQAFRRVAVNGAVTKPDVYMVDVTMNLRDVIARAGGVSSEGNPKKVSILRGDQQINVPDWERSLTAMSQLRSGDQVMVGRKSWLLLNLGQVAGAVGVAASIFLALRR